MAERNLFGYDLSEIDNINESLVIEFMGEIINEDKSMCRCQLCIEDIFALSMNKIPPLYVQSTFKESTFKGYDLTKVLDRKKVKKAVQEAISRVSRYPHH